jgi:hypothetical protein
MPCAVGGWKYIAEKVTKNCLQCSTEFISLVIADRKFCSRTCYREWRKGKTGEEIYGAEKARALRSAHAGENNPSYKEKVILICKNCQTEFEIRPSSSQRIFCSDDCWKEYRTKNQTKEGNPNWKGGGKETVCINPRCFKPFFVLRGSKQRYCSLDCSRQHQFGDKEGKRWASGSKWGSKNKKSGTREDIGIFVRSAWEANYARFLKWLKEKGDIKDWDYEKETFEFKGIKKGTRFYTPDFRVTNNDESIEYHEVKGWKHPKGETALSRMKKYHPEIKIILIDAVYYEDLKKKMSRLIPNWE